jgi:predicted MFS family arabinose efflux permease
VFAIPALALVPQNGWVLACALVVLQRVGKAIKKPAKNALISFAASQTGAGKGFAVQEFVDQIGAFLGPVILFFVLLVRRDGDTFADYRLCFLVLGVPALVTIALLFFARRRYPHPENFEPEDETPARFRANATFWTYIAGISCLAFGFIDFPLITLHISRQALVPADALPLLYAGAMVVDAFAALWFGYLFDKRGIGALIVSTAISAVSAAFIFGFSGLWTTLLGILTWGVGRGAQESVLKSVVKGVVPKSGRAAGYGVFETAFGAAWFVGSLVTGLLYDASRPWMVVVSVGMQLAAIPFLRRTMRLARADGAKAAR